MERSNVSHTSVFEFTVRALLHTGSNSYRNVGALIIRIGFGDVLGDHYTIFIIRNPQNSIGNY